MIEGKSDEPEMPGFEGLAEDMEKAMAEARKAMDDLPPLEELGAVQEAMAGLAAMGTALEKMRLAAQQRDELLAEMVGEPNWRFKAEITVRKGASPLMKVELTADFDLEKIVEGHEILSSEEALAQIAATLQGMGVDREAIQEEVARGLGLAMIRELNLVECHIPGAPSSALDELALAPEAIIPLRVSGERELCFEFASALTIRAPTDDPAWEKADLPKFTPTIDEVRVGLDSFDPGEPFQCTLTVSQDELELRLKLAFRPV